MTLLNGNAIILELCFIYTSKKHCLSFAQICHGMATVSHSAFLSLSTPQALPYAEGLMEVKG